MSRALPALFLALALPTAAWAHLSTPYPGIGPALAKAPIVAAVKVIGPTRSAGDERLTAVVRVRALVGEVPESFDLVQSAAHAQPLVPDTMLLVPLAKTPAGRFAYRAPARRPLRLDEGTLRATERFVADWRAHAEKAPAARVDEWIGLTRHASSVARRAAFEALVKHADALRPAMNDARLVVLAAPLQEPEIDDAQRAAVVRVLGLLGGSGGADLLASRFGRLTPPRIRYLAAGVLARHPTPRARQALARCATDEADRLAPRCGRLLARLPRADAP